MYGKIAKKLPEFRVAAEKERSGSVRGVCNEDIIHGAVYTNTASNYANPVLVIFPIIVSHVIHSYFAMHRFNRHCQHRTGISRVGPRFSSCDRNFSKSNLFLVIVMKYICSSSWIGMLENIGGKIFQSHGLSAKNLDKRAIEIREKSKIEFAKFYREFCA